jgi:hypothetical protein
VKDAGSRTARAWTAATIAGVVGIVAVAFLIRIPAPPIPAEGPTPPSVRLLDPVVIQATMLRDPTPLFLPTEFNNSRKDYVLWEPGGTFAGFRAPWTFDEAGLELHLPPPTAVPASPAETLAGGPPGAPFLGFGRINTVVEPISPRTAYVEIMDAGTGRKVFAEPLVDAHPPVSSVPWQPMEFMAAVDPAGLVGPLVPTTRSGVDEVDSYFRLYLADTLRVGQRLSPGFYRISVGP